MVQRSDWNVVRESRKDSEIANCKDTEAIDITRELTSFSTGDPPAIERRALVDVAWCGLLSLSISVGTFSHLRGKQKHKHKLHHRFGSSQEFGYETAQTRNLC